VVERNHARPRRHTPTQGSYNFQRELLDIVTIECAPHALGLLVEHALHDEQRDAELADAEDLGGSAPEMPRMGRSTLVTDGSLTPPGRRSELGDQAWGK
jgi:hypothetical protein